MRIQAAILCDHAQVREGLLFVSAGGISRLYRPPDQPAGPLGLVLAVILEIDSDQVETVHEVRVTITREGGEEIGTLPAALQGPPGAAANLNPGEPAVVPIVLPISGMIIPAFGMYDVRVSADGGVPEILTVYVQPGPPHSFGVPPPD